jgi:hypothetical protein
MTHFSASRLRYMTAMGEVWGRMAAPGNAEVSVDFVLYATGWADS